MIIHFNSVRIFKVINSNKEENVEDESGGGGRRRKWAGFGLRSGGSRGGGGAL